ncbi:Fic family protein [Elizabethkingia sp. JS20170427COW]|uniref:Fic family protein n=1 Tax=Elizabethkingia sp. JS20170427COW TaxID=2583851 RepID=UPI001110A272|nr:hypothetical protein [Elizabethkingia sp. JS20170427COW]QCX53437.1 hypothetical protein FGE20_06650 [Elizabethkingia sp. JS20170427COW]
MRIFKDIELVEQLGPGIPRILQSYSKGCFKFADNYVRMSFPITSITEQVIKIISILEHEMLIKELMEKLHIKHYPIFLYNYIKPALEMGVVEMTLPDKTNSKNQKYRWSDVGHNYKK